MYETSVKPGGLGLPLLGFYQSPPAVASALGEPKEWGVLLPLRPFRVVM